MLLLLIITNKILVTYRNVKFFMKHFKNDKSCSLFSFSIDFILLSDYFQFSAFLESTVYSYLCYKIL